VLSSAAPPLRRSAAPPLRRSAAPPLRRSACVPFLASALLAIGCGISADGAPESSSTARYYAARPAPAHRTCLVPSTAHLDLGRVQAGGITESIVYLANQSPRDIEIAKLEVGCECISFKLPCRDIAAGERVAAEVRLNLAREPEFVGGLSIDVRGLDADGAERFSLVVVATVARGDGTCDGLEPKELAR